jgi:PEP-CTERM motif
LLGLSVAGLVGAGPVLFSVTPIQLPAGYTALPDVGQNNGGINNLGQVVNIAAGPNNTFVPFIATSSSVTIVPFSMFAEHVFINDSGQIAGWSEDASFAFHAFVGDSTGTTLVPLPNGATQAVVNGFNNSGEIVGNIYPFVPNSAFMGTGTSSVLLPFSSGDGINDLGQVLVEQGSQLLILTGASSVLYPVSGALGLALNNAGQAVGEVNTPGGASAFITTTTALTLIPGGMEFPSVNNFGVVVGNQSGLAGALIWDPINGTQLLSSLAPPGWTIETVGGINDLGQISAFASFTDPNVPGATASFTGRVILNPVVPEPGTFAMSLAGMVVFGAAWIIRRRGLV